MNQAGSKIVFWETVDSTNRYAHEHFDELDDGAVVWALEQTNGRGRLGRNWISPKGENLYVSCIAKQIRDPFLATASGALASLKILREAAPDIPFYLKWPNDIYCGAAKVCGVLSEAVFETSLRGIVIGMGINVNSTAETLSLAGSEAASLRTLTGNVFSLKKMVLSLEKHFNACYIKYLNDPKSLFAEWKTENRLLGKELEFVLPDGRVIRSVFLDIAETGEAVILDGGERKIFSCGDIRIVKESIKSLTTKTT